MENLKTVKHWAGGCRKSTLSAIDLSIIVIFRVLRVSTSGETVAGNHAITLG